MDMNINERIDELKNELVSSTQELLKIKSTEDIAKPGMPFGEGPFKALETALKISESLGLKTKNLDGYVGFAEIGDSEDYVAILGHVDVVPEGDGWKYPPYGAEIHDDKIYARGALDDKGPMMAALYGLKAIMDCNLKLSKRVRFIFGANEESDCLDIEHYLKVEKPPILGFTPDSEYPMIYGEKGITLFNLVADLKILPSNGYSIKYIKGGLKENMVPDYAEAAIITENTSDVIIALEDFARRTGYKMEVDEKEDLLILKSFGVSAHGSVPELGKNAIMQLLSFLGTMDLGKSDIGELINFYNRNIGMEVDGDSFGVNLSDKESGSLSFNVGVIEMTEYKCTLKLNLRYPVTCSFEDLDKPLKEKLLDTGIRIENMKNWNPLFFPEDHILIETLKKVYSEQTGLDATPVALGGGTYAKEMDNIVAFGPLFPGQPDLAHQVNEYIEIEDLIRNAKVYAHAIYELAK